MKIIIGESQQKFLITEGNESELKKIAKSIVDYAKNLKKRVSKELGISYRFLITWGMAIGGVGRPLEEFLRGENPELTSTEITKIMVAALAMLYYNNKEQVSELYDEIKKEGLLPVLKKVHAKGKILMKLFREFMKNLAKLGHQFADIMSYTFLIPLVGYLDYIYKDDVLTVGDFKDIVSRLIASGVFVVGGNMVKDILLKIVKDLEDDTENT